MDFFIYYKYKCSISEEETLEVMESFFGKFSKTGGNVFKFFHNPNLHDLSFNTKSRLFLNSNFLCTRVKVRLHGAIFSCPCNAICCIACAWKNCTVSHRCFYVPCDKISWKNVATTRNKIESILFCCTLQHRFYVLHDRICKYCTV